MANNWAIVVGINHYDFLPNASLKFAAADALAMRKFLCEEAGFDSDKVTLCGNAELSSKKASRPILREILIDHRRKALNADNLWFFFSGHGFGGERSEDYLMTVDGNPYDLKETAISVSFVADCLRESKAKNIFLVLDMCRDEILDMEKKGIVELNRADQQAIVMIYSCDRHQSSYEISAFKQGAFTYALLKGLRKQETLGDLEKYLELRIPELHESVGKQGRRQTPRVNPNPGWKLNKSVFFPHAVEVDIAALIGNAIDAESDGDFKKTLNLWEQVKVAAKSEGDRSRAIKKIENLTKRLNPPKIVSPPTTPKPEIKTPLPTYIPTVKKPVIPESQPPFVPQVQKSQLRDVKPTPAPVAREIKATPAPPIVSAPPQKVAEVKPSSQLKTASASTKTKVKGSKLSFPWIALALVLLGYALIGIVVGFSSWTWTWAGALVLALAGASKALALGGVGALTLTLALGGVGAWIWGKTGAWSGASAWAWASAWAGAGAWAGALVLALADVFWFTIVGPILGGAIGGYFTSIGIWAGAGVGLATVIQFWLIIGGLINATDVLEKSYRKNQIVLIFGIISILGLALGCCISWWLMSR